LYGIYKWRSYINKIKNSSHFSLHFDSILSQKAPKYFILNVLKRSLILDQLAADSFEEECSVLNITLLVEPTAF
jgi:hypothetical protein